MTGARARSLEQDLLWSVLDQDAIPHILKMARDNWNVDEPAAWSALVRQAQLGRLRAYRAGAPAHTLDVVSASFGDLAHDYDVFVEPTAATRERLAEIGASNR